MGPAPVGRRRSRPISVAVSQGLTHTWQVRCRPNLGHTCQILGRPGSRRWHVHSVGGFAPHPTVAHACEPSRKPSFDRLQGCLPGMAKVGTCMRAGSGLQRNRAAKGGGMQFRAKQIVAPKEWGTFEDLCHALFKRVWKDPLAQKNGRRGQKQHGVDVVGSEDGDRRSYRGVQCKGKDANYGSSADWPEILSKVAKADSFSPKLEHWIFATTAPVDAALQKLARELSVKRRALGLFSIDVLGWEEILALMADAPEVVAEFYPEHANHLPAVMEALRALPSLETKLATLVDRLDANLGNHGLPPRLLENLAFRFGFTHANALPEELEAFLRDKSVEFAALQLRLSQMQIIEGAVSTLIASADAALQAGDFQRADQHLQEAEQVQLTSATVAAVAKQSELRAARAQAALLSGDVGVAATHWAMAATYFQPFDRNKEAETRYAACDELRGHGYRYRSVAALLSAETALLLNQEIWTRAANLKGWCRTTNALGVTRWRLAQFDDPTNFDKHIGGAKKALEAVRAACSKTVLPYYFAASSGNLASLYCERRLSASAQDYASNVGANIEMQLQAVDVLSKENYPLEWGIFHHNIGTSYISLAQVLTDKSKKLDALNSSVAHLEKSFEVREPEEALQYWIASSRSLAEALIDKGVVETGDSSRRDMSCARAILERALARINEGEHPHQWAKLQSQLARIGPE